MARSARYEFSRVLKGGRVSDESIIDALANAEPVEARRYKWVVVDFELAHLNYKGKPVQYGWGWLAKYDPEAGVDLVDEAHRKTRPKREPNLQQARSRFVFFPSESCICHHHIWNKITARDFRTQLAALIESHHKQFFAECELAPITDVEQFISKLTRFDSISEIAVRVTPPNPLFAPFWKSLKEYLEVRRLKQLRLRESGKGEGGINSRAPELARQMENGSLDQEEPVPVGDAAVLMAADGYGKAQITGRVETRTIVIKTTQSPAILSLPLDATREDLAKAAYTELRDMNRRRSLKH